MVKSDWLSINIDKPEGVYFAGEVVSGTLTVNIKERAKINFIKLDFSCNALVKWHQSSLSSIKFYSASDAYFASSLKFMEKQDKNDLYIEVGEYSYPFNFQLPSSNIPTSYEQRVEGYNLTTAFTRYSLKATIDAPWSRDKEVEKIITVLTHADLNLNAVSLNQPCHLSETKVLCCCCCKSDPVVSTFSVSKTGFVPGEPILFNVTIDNQSNNSMVFQVTLMQKRECTAAGKTQTSSKVLTHAAGKEKTLQPRSREDWNGAIIVPPVCPTSDGTCPFITITYYLLLYVTPSGTGLPFDAEIPIVIGTIPLAKENVDHTPPYSFKCYDKSYLYPASDSKGHANQASEIEKEEDKVTINKNDTWNPSYIYYEYPIVH